MAYREVARMDIDQVIRRWLAGEKIRAIARSTGLDRNTIRRIVRSAEKVGVQREAPWPDEGKLQAIRQRIGRPGATAAASEVEQRLKPRADQIRAWLEKDRLLLTKVHELLGRDGLLVSYSALYRFARRCCEFGTASSITVRRAESQPGEMAEADFSRLGVLQELGSCRPRVPRFHPDPRLQPGQLCDPCFQAGSAHRHRLLRTRLGVFWWLSAAYRH